MFLVLFFLFYILLFIVFFFFKQKTAYEMRISDWSSDVCSSDLIDRIADAGGGDIAGHVHRHRQALSGGGGGTQHQGRGRQQLRKDNKIGRASCRERVWQYV